MLTKSLRTVSFKSKAVLLVNSIGVQILITETLRPSAVEPHAGLSVVRFKARLKAAESARHTHTHNGKSVGRERAMVFTIKAPKSRLKQQPQAQTKEAREKSN